MKLPSRIGPLLAVAITSMLVMVGVPAAQATTVDSGSFSEALAALSTQSVYYDSAYDGNVRGADIRDLEQHISGKNEPVKVAFLPSSAANEAAGGQAGTAQVLLTELGLSGWQGSVAVVMPGVIVTASSTVASHAQLLEAAAQSKGSRGNIAVLRDWVDRLAKSNEPPGQFWRDLWGWAKWPLIVGGLVALGWLVFFRLTAISRSVSHRKHEADLASRQSQYRQQGISIAMWRAANRQGAGPGSAPDATINGWLDAALQRHEQTTSTDPDARILDDVEALLVKVADRHTRVLERPSPAHPVPATPPDAP